MGEGENVRRQGAPYCFEAQSLRVLVYAHFRCTIENCVVKWRRRFMRQGYGNVIAIIGLCLFGYFGGVAFFQLIYHAISEGISMYIALSSQNDIFWVNFGLGVSVLFVSLLIRYFLVE